MHIKPILSRGEVFIQNDGTVTLAPLQVFETMNGFTVIRLGSNVYVFNEEGEYDGSEHMFPSKPDDGDMNAVVEALQQAQQNRGRRPEHPYYAPGSPGAHAEMAAWPTDGADTVPSEHTGKIYGVTPSVPEKN